MRLWSLHPKYLDPAGLVAAWREALLARAVIRGETRGYQHHPQLERFMVQSSPRLAINAYLAVLHDESLLRGYKFDRSKVGPVRHIPQIPVTHGQLEHEWNHLLRKLEVRSPALFAKWCDDVALQCHPSFISVPGPIATWERA